MVVGVAVALSLPFLLHAALVGKVGTGQMAVGLAALPFATVPLRWRRRYPGLVLATVAAAFVGVALFGGIEPNPVGSLFGVGAAALYGDRRVRLVAGIAALSALVLAFAVVLLTGGTRPLGHLAATAPTTPAAPPRPNATASPGSSTTWCPTTSA